MGRKQVAEMERGFSSRFNTNDLMPLRMATGTDDLDAGDDLLFTSDKPDLLAVLQFLEINRPVCIDGPFIRMEDVLPFLLLDYMVCAGKCQCELTILCFRDYPSSMIEIIMGQNDKLNLFTPDTGMLQVFND